MPLSRRLLGVALLGATYAPLHRLLDPARTGPAGSATRAAAEAAWSLGLSGTLIVVTFSWVCVRMIPLRRVPKVPTGVLARMLTMPALTYATGIGVLTTVLASGVALVLYGGAPTSVDEMAQLLHSQAIASGRLTIPLPGSDAAWIIQNGVVLDGRWASIYPPLHTLVLALGVILGAPWLVGPVAIGVATALTARSAEHLMGVGPGRAAGLLLAISPFWLLLGGTHLSHTTAAAGLALVLWSGIKARGGETACALDRGTTSVLAGGTVWALATGAAVGIAVSARPWVGLTCSTAILATLWLPRSAWPRAGAAAWLRRLAAVGAGGAPFAALLLWWNARLFGHPFRLGYSAAFGPAHGLGLGVDPWGNRYGVIEAVAYTGADLTQLGIRLFESPLPALAVIGAVLLMRPLGKGAGVFGAWAAAAVAANALYWHHGIHMGPRMLHESAPAWAALFAAAACTVFQAGASQGQGVNQPTTLRRLARWSTGVAIIGGVVLAPSALRIQARTANEVPAPRPPAGDAVVFVHGSWASRVSASLAASGMRRDSIETALRRNDICAVDRYARWRTSTVSPVTDQVRTPPVLDLEPLPGTPPSLESMTLSPGNLVRVSRSSAHDAACVREARSDRFGTVELEVLAWRTPPLPGRRVLVARDLGPARNLAVLQALGRTAYVYLDAAASDGPTLLEYDEGMELLWGGAAGDITIPGAR